MNKLFLVAAATAVSAEFTHSGAMMDAFAKFKADFNRVYESADHEARALSAFADNLAKAVERNAHGGAVHGVTKFMDMTPEEFKRTMLTYRPNANKHQRKREVVDEATLGFAPKKVNWFTDKSLGYSVVSPVKDQGACGSCWAFSATEQVETVYAMTNKVNVPQLSTQQIVACDKTDAGCNGGDTVSAFEYLQGTGMELAKDYPDTSSGSGQTHECHFNKTAVLPGTTVDNGSLFCLPECYEGDCNKGKRADKKVQKCIAAAPQSICVNAEVWQTYSSGVLTDKECGDHGAASLDHCVQVVGYNLEAPEPYYIVKNSWAEDWGYDGFIHLAIGNTCGIYDEMLTLTLK